jgi:hypothetical protein
MKSHSAWVRSSLIVSGLIAFDMCGCSTPSPAPDLPAVAAAKKEAVKGGWKRVEVVRATFEDGRWLILLRRSPGAPGEHAMFEVA